MKIVKIVDAVYINGVPATIGTAVKPYDMIDARQGVVELEGGMQLAYMSTRLVDLEEPVVTEGVEVTQENPSPAEPEVPTTTEKVASKTK